MQLPFQLGYLYRLHILTASDNPIPYDFLALLEQPSSNPSGQPSSGLLQLLGSLLDQLPREFYYVVKVFFYSLTLTTD